MEQRVQIATHFKIDPAKEKIGAINYPEMVQVTLAVGDKMDVKKVSFDMAITPEQKAKIDEFMKELILESGRTAKAVSAPATTKPVAAATATTPVSTPADQQAVVEESTNDEEMSLFD
jgi:ribosomal protein L12E/L44/L45/RPP1/RPP2